MAETGVAPTEAEAAVVPPAESPPVATLEAPPDVTVIRDQLREKDQLVTALTERLEQAAEQLDRLRRTGADKGRRVTGVAGPGGNLPLELVEEHKTTIEDLKKVITNWENIHAGESLARIEAQVGEIRDMLAGSAGGHISVSSAAHAVPARERPAESSPGTPRPAEAAASHAPSSPGTNSWWEKQKAAMMGEPVPAEPQAAAAPAPAAAPAAEPEPQPAAVAASPAQPVGTFDITTFTVPELPATVDLEKITIDDARVAIRERDRLIEKLREPLLLLKAASQVPGGTASGAEIPPAVKECITQLETQWQAKFRQAELDLSLERARLAREYAAIKQQQEALPRGGSKPAAPPAGKGTRAAEPAPAAEEDSSARSRWFRFMGTGDKSGDTPAKK